LQNCPDKFQVRGRLPLPPSSTPLSKLQLTWVVILSCRLGGRAAALPALATCAGVQISGRPILKQCSSQITNIYATSQVTLYYVPLGLGLRREVGPADSLVVPWFSG